MKKTLIILAATFVAGAATAQTQPAQSTKKIDVEQSVKTEKAAVSSSVSGQSSTTVDVQPATEAVKNTAKAAKRRTKQAVTGTTERVGNTTEAGVGKVKKIGSAAANSSVEVNGSASASAQAGNRINSNTSFNANKKVSAAGAIDNTRAGTTNLRNNTSGIVKENAASIRSNTSKAAAAPGVTPKAKLNSNNTIKTSKAIKTKPASIKAATNGGIRGSLGL